MPNKCLDRGNEECQVTEVTEEGDVPVGGGRRAQMQFFYGQIPFSEFNCIQFVCRTLFAQILRRKISNFAKIKKMQMRKEQDQNNQ